MSPSGFNSGFKPNPALQAMQAKMAQTRAEHAKSAPQAGFRPNAALQAMQAKMASTAANTVRNTATGRQPAAFRPNPALQAAQAKVAQMRQQPSGFQPNSALQAMQARMGQTPGSRSPAPAPVAMTGGFRPNAALQAAQSRMAGLRAPAYAGTSPGGGGSRTSASTCGCASCSCSGQRKRRPAVQRQIIQRKTIQRSQESEYEYETEMETSDSSDSDACEDDNCIDSDCDVKDTYHQNGTARSLSQTIRSRFYPGWDVAVQNWAALRLAALGANCPANQFKCEHCNGCYPDNQYSIDHVTPVVQHWNQTGRNTDQATRAQWYRNTNNLEIVYAPHNSSMGGGGQVYQRDVGPNFSGGPNC